MVEFHFSIAWSKERLWLIFAIFLSTRCQFKNDIVVFSSSKSDNDKFDVKQSSHSPTMQTSWLESQAFASTKSCTLVAKIFDFRLELIPFAKSTAFLQSSHKQEDCGIWSFQASSLCPFKNSYSWRKLRSRWNVSGKEACCSLVITFDALIIASKSRIFQRRYLFCLYWRLPWSIPT